jgi:[ribosomal protein S5]-alanine N-acetyltransferase
MPQPTYFLKSARLGFRCWSPDDLPLARRLWGDTQVTRFFGGPFDDAEVARRLQREIDRMEAHGIQYWAIYMRSDDDHVGCCGLRHYRLDEQIHELGFHLRPEYWGKGLAIEAARAVIPYGFETIGAKALSAGHHPENLSSKRVLEKLGFIYTHDEFFEALGIDIPYYLLTKAQAAPASIGRDLLAEFR